MARGPTAERRVGSREPLSTRVPKEVKGDKEVEKIYKGLVKELIQEGFVCQADWRTVWLLAKTEAQEKKLMEVMNGLPGPTITTGSGQERIHPVVSELRQVRSSLRGLYETLFMAPKARSACRLTMETARTIGVQAPDDMDDFLAGRINVS